MPTIELSLEGDGAWPDLEGSAGVVHLQDATWKLAALEGGMASGAASLALRLDLGDAGFDADIPNGRVVIAETSLAAWIAVTAALRARYPAAFAGTPLE